MEQKNCRILRFVPSLYYPSYRNCQNIGGVQIQTYRLIKELSKYNIIQDILTKNNGDFKKENVNILKSSKTSTIGLLLSSVVYLWRNKKLYNCIHIHADGGPCPLLFGQIAHVFFKIPIIYTFHCCRNATYKAKGFEILIMPFMNKLERKCINQSEHCVFLSVMAIDILKKKGVLKERNKYSFISDCIELSNKKEDSIEKTKKMEISYIGRISKEKGWDIFMECTKKLKNDGFQFHIYGSGPQRKKLIKFMKKYKLTNVYYHGAIPNAKVYEAISTSNIIIIPSYFEELGSVVLEAGIMRKNVIASNIGGLVEILSNDRGYLAKVGNVEDFCQGIKYIVDNDIFYGDKLYDYVMENHRVDKKVVDYLRIYESL